VPYLFTAKELDEETGLYYFGARYYDPRTSVWQSGDPILGKYLPSAGRSDPSKLPGMGGVFAPTNLALYSYSHLNPVRYIDPDGLATWPVWRSTELVRGGSTGYVGYYGWVRDSGATPHLAVDIKAREGTLVRAFEGGRVIRADWESKANKKLGYGLRVVVEHQRDGETYYSVYGHLERISPEVKAALGKKGDAAIIPEGAEIGRVGRTGNVPKDSPSHLHFEIAEGVPYKQSDSGADPATYFGTWDRIKNFLRGTPIPDTRPPAKPAE
jgi:RHS repeat-associated protein